MCSRKHLWCLCITFIAFSCSIFVNTEDRKQTNRYKEAYFQQFTSESDKLFYKLIVEDYNLEQEGEEYFTPPSVNYSKHAYSEALKYANLHKKIIAYYDNYKHETSCAQKESNKSNRQIILLHFLNKISGIPSESLAWLAVRCIYIKEFVPCYILILENSDFLLEGYKINHLVAAWSLMESGENKNTLTRIMALKTKVFNHQHLNYLISEMDTDCQSMFRNAALNLSLIGDKIRPSLITDKDLNTIFELTKKRSQTKETLHCLYHLGLAFRHRTNWAIKAWEHILENYPNYEPMGKTSGHEDSLLLNSLSAINARVSTDKYILYCITILPKFGTNTAGEILKREGVDEKWLYYANKGDMYYYRKILLWYLKKRKDICKQLLNRKYHKEELELLIVNEVKQNPSLYNSEKQLIDTIEEKCISKLKKLGVPLPGKKAQVLQKKE